jgi:integrase
MVTEKRTKKGNRVYKLRESAKTYTLRKRVDGKDRFFNLGTDLRIACQKADEIDAYLYFHSLEETIEKFNPNRIKKGNVPTVGELIKQYSSVKDLLDVKPRSVKSYVGSFKRLMKIGGRKKDPTTATCGTDWTQIYNLFRREMMEGVDEEDEILSRKRTCNSVLRNAKSLVTDEAMTYYSNWDMSWADELKRLRGYKKVAVHYSLPDEKLIKDTHEYLENLKCDFRFTMLALALHAGMRRNEIAHCRREWFDLSGDVENSIVIKNDRNFVPKTGHGGTTLIKNKWAKLIYARANGIDYLLEGIDRSRQGSIDDAFEPLLKDLRALGWDRQSPLHECRKLYGAFLASTDSLYKAQKCLRHTSPQITSDSYSDLIVAPQVIGLWA